MNTPPRLVSGLATLLLLVAGSAPAEPPLTHEQALQELDQSHAEARRRAVARLGEIGVMSDTPALLKRLRDVEWPTRGIAEDALWQVWSRSGDEQIDTLFQQGLAQMHEGPVHQALAKFRKIIELKPDFAEGWNKRATLYFIMGEYEKSLRDCDEVMKRNPYHFGALAGYGQIYSRLDRPELALEYFRRALDLNPNLHGVELAIKRLKQEISEKRKRTI